MEIKGVGGASGIPDDYSTLSSDSLKDVCITLNNMFSNSNFLKLNSSIQPITLQLAILYGNPATTASDISQLVDKALITPLETAKQQINDIPSKQWDEDTSSVSQDINDLLNVVNGVLKNLVNDVNNKSTTKQFCDDLEPINQIFDLSKPLPYSSPYYQVQAELNPSGDPEDPPCDYYGLVYYVSRQASSA